MSDDGGYRKNDPWTSKRGARSIKARSIIRSILRALDKSRTPLNGWELSTALNMPTITVVPRLAPMRRDGWITLAGDRPGPPPKFVAQLAYVISDLGRDILSRPVPVPAPTPPAPQLPL